MIEKMSTSLVVRRATADDSEFLLCLRNEKGVRMSFWNASPVERETHERWLTVTLKNLFRVLCVVEVEGELIGQVRFDLASDKRTAETSISLTVASRGRGYGAKSLIAARERLAAEVPNIRTIYAHIKPGNEGSVKAFEKSGYRRTERTEYEGHPCIEMVLS